MKIVIISEGDPPPLFPGAAYATTLLRTVGELEAHRDADLYIDLDFRVDPERLSALDLLLPAPVIVNSVTPTLAEIGHPFIRVNGWPGFLERAVHELVVPDETLGLKISGLYQDLGHSHCLAPDTPGMITARILATIINEAWFTWEAGVSTKEEIDTAMKLGTNYPFGPFEWGERIGLSRICQLLTALSKTNPAYTPANSLQNGVDALKYD